MTQLLTAKLRIPSLQPDLVLRPRLTQKLNACTENRLAVISAPAGFGKTTLLAEWYASSERCRLPLAWLSLEDDDNQMARFLAYLIAAINSLDPKPIVEAQKMLQSPQTAGDKDILATLLGEVGNYPQPFALVLDDYHNLSAEPLQRAVEFLIGHLPSNMHLIIATRMAPSLPLARWRVRGELVEIRADDLRFTHEEATDYLAQSLGATLSNEAITALETRTEGWIAGLKLAALALQTPHNGHAASIPPEFIHSLNGNHRLIADYLVEEVMNTQPEDVRLFLLQTSVLTCLCGPLCDAVTGQYNGQAMLEQLERENLFIVQLDEQRTWYRYHHLFADLLRQKLDQLYPGRAAELRRSVAEWYLQNDYAECAIEEALDAQEFHLAAGWIAQLRPTLVESGQQETIAQWVKAIPSGLLNAYPELARLQTHKDENPLTQRELDVLRRIAAGSSNREIAEILVVSLGTVKKHLNNIFAKLGVRSRTQALARARELGLL